MYQVFEFVSLTRSPFTAPFTDRDDAERWFSQWLDGVGGKIVDREADRTAIDIAVAVKGAIRLFAIEKAAP